MIKQPSLPRRLLTKTWNCCCTRGTPQSSSNRDAPAKRANKARYGANTPELCTLYHGSRGSEKPVATSWAENIKRLAQKSRFLMFCPPGPGTAPLHQNHLLHLQHKVHIDWAACPYPHFVFKSARKLYMIPAGNAVLPFAFVAWFCLWKFVGQGQPHRWTFPNYRENGASEWAETQARASTFPDTYLDPHPCQTRRLNNPGNSSAIAN